MKTLRFLLVAAFLVMISGCTKTDEMSAADLALKSAENGNYTEQFYWHPGPIYDEDGNFIGNEYWAPIICDGVEVDYLYGDGENLTVHAIIHYKNFKPVWGKFLVKGNLTSTLTGETFAIHEWNFQDPPEEEDGIYIIRTRTNAIGDKGTHYIFYGIWTFSEADGINLDILTAKCVPEKKNK
jgi:hypothetical protein